jgi:hypothetical protein
MAMMIKGRMSSLAMSFTGDSSPLRPEAGQRFRGRWFDDADDAKGGGEPLSWVLSYRGGDLAQPPFGPPFDRGRRAGT